LFAINRTSRADHSYCRTIEHDYLTSPKSEGVSIMSGTQKTGTFRLGKRSVKRLGYGAMQLAVPRFGPPKDHDAALTVMRDAGCNAV